MYHTTIHAFSERGGQPAGPPLSEWLRELRSECIAFIRIHATRTNALILHVRGPQYRFPACSRRVALSAIMV